MRITSEGQVVIPADIQEKAGLLPGTEVELVLEGNTVRIVPRAAPPKTKGAALVAHLRGRGDIKVTTDEVMRMTRGLPEDGA